MKMYDACEGTKPQPKVQTTFLSEKNRTRSSIHGEVKKYKNTRKDRTGIDATVEYKEAPYIIHT